MTTPDWPALYATEVTPVMERFAAPTPTGVWIAVAVLIVLGLALLFLASGSTRLAGLVPLGTAGFILYMTVGQPSRVGDPARYRIGTVTALDQKKVVESTTTGVDRPRIVYSVVLEVSEMGAFDADGARPGTAADLGEERLYLPKQLWEQLAVGERAVLASNPGAYEGVAFAVDEDGSALR